MDAQEKVETPRSTLREIMLSMKFPKFVALICSVINSETSSVRHCTRVEGRIGSSWLFENYLPR